MASQVYESAIPSPYGEEFVNGEMALSPSEIPSDTPVGTHYLSTRRVFKSGVYNIKAWIYPAGTLTIDGVTLNSINGLLKTQINVPAGEQRIDVTLTKSTEGQACFVAFFLFYADLSIYASRAEGWMTDDSVVPENELPEAEDPRFSMSVFPFTPNWENGISERFTYLTNVMVSESGAEQRRAMRVYPRRSIEADFLRASMQRSRLDAFFTGVGYKEFLLPLWHEQFYSTDPVVELETHHFYTVTGDTLDKREIEVGTILLITQGNPLEYDLCLVGGINLETGMVAWDTNHRPTRFWPAGSTKLIPVVRALLAEKTTMNNPNDSVGQISLRFDVMEPMKFFSHDWNERIPLFSFKADYQTPIEIGYDRYVHVLDNDVAMPEYTEPVSRAITSERGGFKFFGRDQMIAFRKFISGARGRALNFYVPTYTHDLVPVYSYDLGGTVFLEIKHIGFLEMMPNPQWVRKIVAIVPDDGSEVIYRVILGVDEQETEQGEKIERLQLDEPLPSILGSRIKRIQFLVYARFDQDGFELKHHVDNSAVLQTSLSFVSVPNVNDFDGIEFVTDDEGTWLKILYSWRNWEDVSWSQLEDESWEL